MSRLLYLSGAAKSKALIHFLSRERKKPYISLEFRTEQESIICYSRVYILTENPLGFPLTTR
ncbi:hypothetical protein V1478_018818 [Vespula squamosa]|uniref:Uncharacterized protein n=1 Tax=Vespula squamosa TaxID=30214 RepID=A0ABD1ZTV1_VESSQ